MKPMTYKGYHGTIEYSTYDRCYYGQVIGIRSLVSYEGDTVDQLYQEFTAAVDEYLEDQGVTGQGV